MRGRILITATVVALAFGVGACGGDDSSSSGPVTLNWFIFNEPSGGPLKVAERCSKQSNGAVQDQLRVPARRRPTSSASSSSAASAPKDSSLDLMGLDVVWTGEFANAGWLEPVPASTEQAVTANVFESVLKTASFEDKLVTVPIWSNTQLLWYRKDRVPTPPKTWDEMIDMGEKLGPGEGRIQVQANRYEGLVVLANQLIESAGTSILAGPKQVRLDEAPTKKALQVLGRLSKSRVAAANITTSTEDTARLASRARRARAPRAS